MRFLVYYDESEKGYWISEVESQIIRDICKYYGAETINSKGLLEVLTRHEKAFIVFSKDAIPGEAFRHVIGYVRSGGMIFWLGSTPLSTLSVNGEVRSLSPDYLKHYLGFPPASKPFKVEFAKPTEKGRKLGIFLHTPSCRPTHRAYVDISLQETSWGRSSSWIKYIGEGGIIRILDFRYPLRGAGIIVFMLSLASALREFKVEAKPPRTIMAISEKLSRMKFKLEDSILMSIVTSLILDWRKLVALLSEILPQVKDVRSLIEELKVKARKYYVKAKIYLIAQSHLDWAWLWTWEESLSRSYFTFVNVLRHIKKFKDFKFTQSTPVYFEWMEKYYPRLFSLLREYVKQGRICIVGGSWVEHDCNIPCGESMVRQRLYGQRYYLKKFGKLSEIEWMPDTFGFPWSLPQILVKSGTKYFATVKMEWNDTNKFPFKAFRWKGIDGSEVLAYSGKYLWIPITPHLILDDVKSRNILSREEYSSRREVKLEKVETYPDIMVNYGTGDGGCGPTTLEVKIAKLSELILKDLLVDTTPVEFFKAVERYREKLPIWNDELYLETHRGTYSAQWKIKWLNNRGEVDLLSCEKIATLAYLLGFKYPKEKLDEAWKWLLSYQWHDPLPGSAIREVYEEAERDFKNHVFKHTENIIRRSLEYIVSLSKVNRGNVIAFNTLSWRRKDIIEVNGALKAYFRGRELKSQYDPYTGKTIIVLDLPPLGYKILELRQARENNVVVERREVDETVSVETRFYKVRISNGMITSIFDKELGEFLKSPVNVTSYFCNPKIWDNWNIMKDYVKYPMGTFKPNRIHTVSGEVFKQVVLEGKLEDSNMTWIIRLYENIKRIDNILKIDWRETRRIVKFNIPLNIDAEYCYASIQYGVYPRPMRPRTRFERAKWEFPHQRWVCISDGCRSFTIANQCNYGSSIFNGVYMLTLIKNNTYPDPKCDLYEHFFKISFTTFRGEWFKGKPWKLGEEVSKDIILLKFNKNPKQNYDLGGKRILDDEFSMLHIEPDNVVLDVIKRHEDLNDNIILRLYETAGSQSKVKITVNNIFRVLEVKETNLIELDVDDPNIDFRGNIIEFTIKPWEIKTLRLKISPNI